MVAKIKSKILEIKERIQYSFLMWKWEKQKRQEGFPAEWFEDNPIDEDYLERGENINE